jgi:transcriptional regulator of acetoin/glycerol metabolism
MNKFNRDEQKKLIRESYKRCESLGIKKNRIFSRKIITDEELHRKLEENRALIITAVPFMNEMYDFVKNTDFFCILTDKDGCILNIIGDKNILGEASRLKMIPGAYMNEENIGTNAMSIVLTINIPVQISGEQHFIKSYHKWTCSAAPIRNGKGEIIGVLDLTGYIEYVHLHTLGMVVASARSIEKMLRFENYNNTKKEQKLTKRLLNNQSIYTFDKIIGENENFINTIEYAKKIADSSSAILITGESGTGKEIFAQAIHNYSKRKDMPFVAVNCAAIPYNLIESELFGYDEGAFTGAKKGGNAGKFEMAEEGTIFLDEIGEMPLDMQVSLLRVIEEGVISRIGGCKQIPLNVRIISATNKDLKEEVGKGRFRKDLFYRLNVLPIYLPALRDRKEDISLLIDYYMDKISGELNKKRVEINEICMENLLQWEWSGNVRELENLVELIVNTERVPKEFLYPKAYSTNIEDNGIKHDMWDANMELEFVEKTHIIKVLNKFSGNISLAAKAMRIGRNTLYRKIEKYHIKCSEMPQIIK